MWDVACNFGDGIKENDLVFLGCNTVDSWTMQGLEAPTLENPVLFIACPLFLHICGFNQSLMV